MNPPTPDPESTTPPPAEGVSRRVFLKVLGAVAAVASASPVLFRASSAEADPDPPDDASAVYIHSVCRLCSAACGIKAKVVAGTLVKIEGSPYSPMSRNERERLAFTRTPDTTRTEFGRLCARGQAGVQHVYDPQRIQHPMRRVGARGAGRWETVTWDQCFREIGARINALVPFSDRTTRAINDASSDLGRIANQVIYAPGSSYDPVLAERFFRLGYGTANWGHSDESLHRGNAVALTSLATRDHVTGAAGARDFTPDFARAAYVLLLGPDPIPSPMSRDLIDMRSTTRTGGAGRVVIADPRFSNNASRADQWVPARPDGYAALALGIARVIIEGTRYNAAFLRNANGTAAAAASEASFSDATWLVVTEPGHTDEGRWLTAASAGLSSPIDGRNPVCVRDSDGGIIEAAVTGPTGTSLPGAVGRLVPTDAGRDDITVNGIRCRSAFALFRASVMEHTLDEYARLSGVTTEVITSLATGLATAAPRASVWCGEGALRSSVGTRAQHAALSVNWLLGSIDHAGGLSRGGGTWDDRSSSLGTNLLTVAGGVTSQGPRIDRAGSDYTSARSYYSGPSAPRPWLPFALAGAWQELVPSIEAAYPYAAKALIMGGDAWPYEVPGGRATWERVASDEAALPLLVAISPVMTEAAAWADYVLPEATYLESWGVFSPGASLPVKATLAQQPVVGALDGAAIGASGSWAFNPDARNDYTPAVPDARTHADILLGIARAISPSLPGIGTGALGTGRNFDRAWDLYRTRLEHVARNVGAAVTGAPITPGEVLVRGGVFAPADSVLDARTPALLASRHGGVAHFYLDALATTTDSITTRARRGVAAIEAPRHASGASISDEGFPLKLAPYTQAHHGTSNASASPWLTAISVHNDVELSPTDARALDVERGDHVRVVSASNPAGVAGVVKIVEGQRPGVVSIAHGYGRWENGSRAWRVAGRATTADASRGTGTSANLVMRLDAASRNAPVLDTIGGGCAFLDTWVRVEPTDP